MAIFSARHESTLAHLVDTHCSGCESRCPLANLLITPNWSSSESLMSEVSPVLREGQKIEQSPCLLRIKCSLHPSISRGKKTDVVGTFIDK